MTGAGLQTARDRAGALPGGAPSGRPRMLFLCQTLPFPPDGGVLIRTYNVLRLLAREFDITALCFYRTADRSSPDEVSRSVEGLRPLAHVEVFPIPQEHDRPRFVLDHLRSLVRGRAYTTFVYESAEFRGRLEELLRTGAFDIVHVDSLDLVSYLPAVEHLPVVCVHHNVESALMRRRASTERRPLVRAYLRHQAELLEREERSWCGRVALNVAVSAADRDELARLVPGARSVVVPNGVDTSAFAPSSPGTDGIVFVGGMTWFPNADGMQYFCGEILPLLRARGVHAPVRWVGRAAEEVRRDYLHKHGVELTGYVPDVRPFLDAAACFIVPLRVGGGTRLKILDAWAMGKAVVSTSVGCEGLDARDDENILVRDTPGEFADAVAAVLHDPALQRRLGAGARRTAEEVYEWEVIGRGMLAEYGSLLRLPHGSR